MVTAHTPVQLFFLLPLPPVGQRVTITTMRPRWQVVRPHLEILLTAGLAALLALG